MYIITNIKNLLFLSYNMILFIEFPFSLYDTQNRVPLKFINLFLIKFSYKKFLL